MGPFESRSALSKAFDSVGPYAQYVAEDECGGDPLNLDIEDELEPRQLDLLDLPSPLNRSLDNDSYAECYGEECFNDEFSMEFPDEIPPPSTDPDADVSDYISSYRHEQQPAPWDPIFPVGSNKYTTGVNSRPQSCVMSDMEASRAWSADTAQSPLGYIPHKFVPTHRYTRPQPPSEQEQTPGQEQRDDRSTNPDPQAGVDIEWMEGFGASHFDEPQPELDVPESDPSLGHASNLGNLWAGVGDHFSAPAEACAFGHRGGHKLPSQATSSRHEPNVSGSFPTTHDKYPPHILGLGIVKQQYPSTSSTPLRGAKKETRERAVSSPQVVTSPSKSFRVGGPTYRHRRSTASSARPDSLLSSIAEQREGLVKRTVSYPKEDSEAQQRPTKPPTRAIRTRRLTEDKRRQAAQRRQDRSTCMSCKIRKIPCDGNMPCDKCDKSRDGKLCLLAEWQAFVEEDACDSAFYLAVDPPSLNSGLAGCLNLPSVIYPGSLIQFVVTFQATHSLLVTHVTGSSYLLDLPSCLGLLSSIDRPFRLQDLFAAVKSGASIAAWVNVMRNIDHDVPDNQKLARWALMPSQETYTLIPVNGTATNIELVDPEFLLPAATLSRIVLRATEIRAHQALQKACKSLIAAQSHQSDDVVAHVQNLGKMACLMRTKHAFGERNQYKTYDPLHYQHRSPETQQRVKIVAKIIYFWFREYLKKRDKSVKVDFSGERNLLTVRGQDIHDPFPDSDTQEGFERWLSHGDDVLVQAALVTNSQREQPFPPPAMYPDPFSFRGIYRPRFDML